MKLRFLPAVAILLSLLAPAGYGTTYYVASALPPGQLDRTAVIVRTNTHVVKISSYLSLQGIPCRGKTSPSKEIVGAVIRDLEAYHLLAMGLREGKIPRNALYRVMNRPQRYLLRSAVPDELSAPEELLLHSAGNLSAEEALRDLLRDLHVLGSLNPDSFVKYVFDAVSTPSDTGNGPCPISGRRSPWRSRSLRSQRQQAVRGT